MKAPFYLWGFFTHKTKQKRNQGILKFRSLRCDEAEETNPRNQNSTTSSKKQKEVHRLLLAIVIVLELLRSVCWCRCHCTNSLYLLGRQELLKLYTSTSLEEEDKASNHPLLSFADCRVAKRGVMSSFSFLSFFFYLFLTHYCFRIPSFLMIVIFAAECSGVAPFPSLRHQ